MQGHDKRSHDSPMLFGMRESVRPFINVQLL